MREGLDDALTKLFALLVLVDGNVLDVTDGAETAEELALDEDTADADDAVAGVVDDDEGVVCLGHCAHGVELVHPGVFTEVFDDGEDGEDVEMTAFVVCRRERADLWGRSDVWQTLGGMHGRSARGAAASRPRWRSTPGGT